MALADLPLTELLGFLTGTVNVWLLAKQNIWNWPVGLANNALYVAVFLHSGLYGDAGLQLVYITLGIYGWWLWARRRKVADDDGGGLPVTKTPRQAWMWIAPATVASGVALYFFLAQFTDSTVPEWDALTTALSLAATYGQAKKYLESWWIWILADVIYIPLYVYKNLNLTAALYFIFLILCALGLRSWSLAIRPSQASNERAAA